MMSKRTSAHLIENEAITRRLEEEIEAKKRRLEIEKKQAKETREQYRLETKSIFDDYQLPDELSAFESLLGCDHVLENIMGYLPNKDILSLTLASKSLNAFISVNTKILQKFTMTIPQIDAHNEKDHYFKDIRRYPNWKLEKPIIAKNFDIFTEFFLRYGPHVKKLWVGSTTRALLLTTLKCCENIHQLDIPGNHTYKKEILNFPHLKKLRLNRSYDLLPLFKNCQLQVLEIPIGDNYSKSVNKFFGVFLKAQNELQSLTVNEFPRLLFNDDGMTTVDFKLKSLSFELRDQRLVNNENFLKFLGLHKKSLVELTLKGGSFMNLFEGFNSIKTLTLERSSTSNLSAVWPSVKKLTITGGWYPVLETIESSFPNAVDIKIERVLIGHDFLAQLPKIEKLEIINCSIATNLTCSNLKVLKLNQVTINADANLTWNRSQLKELVVKGFIHMKFIAQLLLREDTKLDHLKLVGEMYMETIIPNWHRFFNQNRHKIETLTIVEK